MNVQKSVHTHQRKAPLRGARVLLARGHTHTSPYIPTPFANRAHPCAHFANVSHTHSRTLLLPSYLGLRPAAALHAGQVHATQTRGTGPYSSAASLADSLLLFIARDTRSSALPRSAFARLRKAVEAFATPLINELCITAVKEESVDTRARAAARTAPPPNKWYVRDASDAHGRARAAMDGDQ